MTRVVRRRGPGASARSAPVLRLDAATRAFAALGLLLHFGGAFTLQLEYTGNEHSTSKILQISYVVFGLFGAHLLFNAPGGAKRAFQLYKPVWRLVALAFVSTLWSTAIAMSIKASLAFLMTNAFALALPTRLGEQALLFLVRVMSLACFLSVVWVFVFPGVGMHQATDAFQTVHAGLWRGIFPHKQTLGTFSGFTIGLLMFYGRMAFPNLILRLGALGCSIACLAGSKSATGFVMSVLLTLMLNLTYAITKLSPAGRRAAIIGFFCFIGLTLALFFAGALSFIPLLLGKSENLTGRGDTWQLVANNFAGSGFRLIIGGGFASDFPWQMSENFPIDSGYFLKLLEFGYLGSLLLILTYGRILLDGIRTLIETPPEGAKTAAFPVAIITVLVVYSITETGLMERHISTIFIAIAVYISASRREAAGERITEPAPSAGPPVLRNLAASRFGASRRV